MSRGAEGDRTLGLQSAILALSQLSYSPNLGMRLPLVRGGVNSISPLTGAGC